jgi:predicted metal-dependent hydrolase
LAVGYASVASTGEASLPGASGLPAFLANQSLGEIVDASRRHVAEDAEINIARRLAARALDLKPWISLNPDLIRAPTACIDYVITHELIHLIHPHHGHAFYELLETLMPDWRKRKQRLERLLS